MRTFSIFALILALVIAGCLQAPPAPPGNNTTVTPPGNNTTASGNNTTAVPPGYEVKDFCKADTDCVRLNKCCDCGLGEYVNTYNQQNPECTGPQCMCPIALSKGVCRDNRCVAEAVPASAGFCGWSTNGSCSGNGDCTTGGCSAQVCQSVSEEPVITNCMYSECYDAASYGVSCGCVGGKCQWG